MSFLVWLCTAATSYLEPGTWNLELETINHKKTPRVNVRSFGGREDRIRTCDPLVPNQMRYRAALLPAFVLGSKRCDPDRIRTYDLLLRRQLLYPAELRGRSKNEVQK